MIELNGISNIRMLIDLYEGETNGIDSFLAEKITKELETLERYMLAIAKVNEYNANRACGDASADIPYWHQVKAEPNKYPTRKEMP